MARIRTIKPEFFKNEDLAELPAMTRLLFIGLWLLADRDGKLEDRPKRIKADIFPYDNIDIEKALDGLQSAGFIVRYKGNVNVTDRVLPPEQPTTEVSIIWIVNFHKHQKIDSYNEKQSNFSFPTEDQYKTIKSLLIDLEKSGKGREGKGRGKEIKSNDFIAIESQTESFKKFQEWMSEETPEVCKMPLPFTIKQYVTLIGQLPDKKSPTGFRPGISKKEVMEYLRAIENNKQYLKKYRSPYLCVINWHSKNSAK